MSAYIIAIYGQTGPEGIPLGDAFPSRSDPFRERNPSDRQMSVHLCQIGISDLLDYNKFPDLFAEIGLDREQIDAARELSTALAE